MTAAPDPSPTPPPATPADRPPLVRATGLRKAHGRGEGRVVALDGVDLDVRRGELLVVRGPSGSGKTTLLHCLAGIAQPDEGSVVHDLGDGTAADLAALDDDARTDLRAARMGLLFQTLNLLPALTAAENVQLPLVLRGLPAAEVRQQAQVALEAVGLADRAGAEPSALSGGQQQRVALARALVTDPEVVYADEPTGALDRTAEQVVLELLRAAVTPERAVVVVSHADAVAQVGDRIVEVVDGRIR